MSSSGNLEVLLLEPPENLHRQLTIPPTLGSNGTCSYWIDSQGETMICCDLEYKKQNEENKCTDKKI